MIFLDAAGSTELLAIHSKIPEYLTEIFLIISVLSFVGEFEHLKVEDGLMRVGLVVKYFDGSIIIYEIFIEECWVVMGLNKYLGIGALIFLLVGFQFAELPFVSA